MRIAVFFGIILALGVTTLSAPRFLSAVAAWPGVQGIELALFGEDLRAETFERARRSLANSARFIDYRAISRSVAVIEHNMGRQARDPKIRDEFYVRSQAAAVESLTLSPVQPMLWLLLAQIHYEQEDYPAAARLFDWALRTSHYMRHQARERAILALALWNLIDEETRVKSMDAIQDAMVREIDLVASLATAAEVDDDLRQRLRSIQPEGVLLAARFSAAINRYRYNERLRVAALEELSAMRQTLIATSMLITAGLPTFAEAMSVHDYLAIRRGEHPTRAPDSVDEYLSAVLDGLLVLGYFNRDEGNALFCVPERQVLDINVAEFKANLDALLEQFQAEMPSFDALARTRSVGLVSLEVLTVMYPCDD